MVAFYHQSGNVMDGGNVPVLNSNSLVLLPADVWCWYLRTDTKKYCIGILRKLHTIYIIAM